MKIIAKISIALLVFISSHSYSSGWSGATKVESIFSVDKNRVVVKLSTFANPDNCMVNGYGDVFFDPQANPDYLSLVLSAYHAKSEVNIYVNSNCTVVWQNTSFAVIHHIRLL